MYCWNQLDESSSIYYVRFFKIPKFKLGGGGGVDFIRTVHSADTKLEMPTK